MGRLRWLLRRLERDNEGLLVSIPQQDGTTARFPQSAMREAFINECRRLRGEDLPVHPLTLAAANSSEPEWYRSAFAEMHAQEEITDLSER